MNGTQIPGLIGYYATPEGIASAHKKGGLLKVDGKRSTSAVVKTSYGRMHVMTLLTTTLGLPAARAWAQTYDRHKRAAWLTFRRDNPQSDTNHWGPLKDWEADWLADYEAEVAA